MSPPPPGGHDGAGRPRVATDAQIFDALAEAITEHGPHRWTLSDVGRRLDLTGPAIAYRFGNKHELLVAFAAHQPQAAADVFDAAAAAASSPREAILDSLVGLISAMKSRTQVANNVAMLSLDLTDDELSRYAQQQTRVIKQRLATLISDCDGQPNSEGETAAEHLYIVWSGAILAWAIDGDGELAEWTRAKLTETLAHLGI